MNYTEEQQAAIDLAGMGTSFVLDAPAGTGKSSTARAISQESFGRVLYLVYNRAARLHAEKTFPPGVTVRTTAQLGWRSYADKYGERMLPGKSSRVPSWETARIANIKDVDLGGGIVISAAAVAELATQTIDRYCYSRDEEFSTKHVCRLPASLGGAQSDYLRDVVLSWAKKIWSSTWNVDSKHRFIVEYAFKAYVLRDIDLGYDTILLDEAQDSNGATERLVKNQMSQQVIIGDPAQQLYHWRGATDIMTRFAGPRLKLTQSFRFGESVGVEAMKWLSHTGTGITIKGLPSISSVITDERIDNPDAVLCRTNIGAMEEALEHLENGRRVAVVGGTSPLLDLAYNASRLMKGEACNNPTFSAFRNWGELVQYSNESGGGDLKPLVRLIHKYGIGEIVTACKNMTTENCDYDVAVSTGHKVKGLEWRKVQIAQDFEESEPAIFENPQTGDPEMGSISPHDAMLNYVAVTRGKEVVSRGGLHWIDRYRTTNTTKESV